MSRGGVRKGAGRKPVHPSLRKNPVSIKIPQWLIEWTKDHPKSRGQIIEDCIREVFKINPPDI